MEWINIKTTLFFYTLVQKKLARFNQNDNIMNPIQFGMCICAPNLRFGIDV